MKKLLNTYQKIKKILTDGKIESNEACIEAKLILKYLFDVSENDFILDREIPDNLKAEKMAEERVKTSHPIQHIIGFAHFMGEDFIVNENTLIPRDETEILVRKAIEIIKEKGFQKVLDIGTGTGCIACSLAKNSDVKVLGVDISAEALNIANQNARKLNLNDKATFKQSDLFLNICEDEKFDMIISNPPYIPPSEKEQIQAEVTFDPELALYTKDELGIEFYKKITQASPKYLNSGGYLMFELGINQADLVKTIMQKSGFKNIEIIKDLAGIERVILGQI